MRSVTIFYILLFYVLLQFCWWAYLLVELNGEVYAHKADNIKFHNVSSVEYEQQKASLKKKLRSKWMMIAGEGVVFLAFVGIGAYKTLQAFKKEVALNKQQQNFLLAITHEFKSPLASIKLNMQTLLKRELEKEKQQSLIKNAVTDTDRLNALVENALYATRIESSNYTLNKQPLSPATVIEEIIAGRTFKVNIETQYTAKPQIMGDHIALTSVFVNLIENAEKYAEAQSKLLISIDVHKDNARIRFADEGIGIAESEKSKIFNKFYRIGNEETRTTKGTGLGLYIVKNVVVQHGGKINVYANAPKGSVFEILLPITS